MHGGEQAVRAARHAAAVLVALLLALCGAVQVAGARSAEAHATPGVSAAAGVAAAPAVAAPAPVDDAGPSHCHRSKDGGGALPAAPATGQQQLLPLALPACLTPQSHSAIGAAHARPPVRGPAPIPPPTPVELSVLRV
ncbi:hypothetical protein [Streptomyces spirodelae]|uniref:Uncharacterized protein n=1 Tax=Streptomyces spirodelae TaxID=2812904 RepID=A0ABS3X2A6_9ACTN|nr:hypothetical protein [Streptomyces spirodelae]MBO8189520.1 hypothetical protein [Streptomyces spirodelae]